MPTEARCRRRDPSDTRPALAECRIASDLRVGESATAREETCAVTEAPGGGYRPPTRTFCLEAARKQIFNELNELNRKRERQKKKTEESSCLTKRKEKVEIKHLR